MGNGNENKIINITQKDLLEILAEETSEALSIMNGDGKDADFSATMLLFMATFSAGVMKRIDTKMKNEEDDLGYEPYHYSERGDK